MTYDSIVWVSPHQVSCDLDGGAAILNLQSGVYYGLDPVGTFIWKLLEKPCTIGGIRDTMLEHFEVDVDRCEADLFELLAKLVQEGLIEVRGSSS